MLIGVPNNLSLDILITFHILNTKPGVEAHTSNTEAGALSLRHLVISITTAI